MTNNILPELDVNSERFQQELYYVSPINLMPYNGDKWANHGALETHIIKLLGCTAHARYILTN